MENEELNQDESEFNEYALEEWCEENHYPRELIEAAQDVCGPKATIEELIDWLEDGNYTVLHADGGSDSDLGMAYVDMLGSLTEVSNKERYFDEQQYKNDLEAEYSSDQKDGESDEEYEERMESEIEAILDEDMYMVENGNAPEDLLERYFDYDQFGYDLRIGDGFYHYGNGIWIATY